MTIRDLHEKDLDQLIVLFDAYRVFYRKESNINGAKEFLSERIKQKESVIFVCENEDKQLVGFVQLYPLFSSTKMKRLWLLNDLFVHQDFRGNGVSKMLINRAKQLVQDTEACGMFLETEKSNVVGNNLYPHTDFELNEGSNFYDWTNS